MTTNNVLITGGTGFLGQHLINHWLANDWQVSVLSRKPQNALQLFGSKINVVKDLNDLASDSYFNTVVNLAGEPIIGARWSKPQKQRIKASRIDLTNQLVSTLASLDKPPELLINASAIGIYGQNDLSELKSITNTADTSFSQQLCIEWESAATSAKKLGIRVCCIRTGLVLAKDNGMLAKMLPAFYLGLGAQLGEGTQWMSWIHIKDWLAIIQFLINHKELNGAFNATAPYPVTNKDFTMRLARVLHRPALLTLPAPLLKLLLGEMSELLLGSQNITPKRLLNSGFQFHYQTLDSALAEILDLQ